MSPFWPEGQAIDVREGPRTPRVFRWQGHRHTISGVSARWRVHTNWWTEHEIWRDYWEVTTDSGLLCVIYCDMITRDWMLERIYE